MLEDFSVIYYKSFLSCVVVKSMAEQEYCRDCGWKHNCQEIYGKLGGSDGPSVTLSVVIAFLAPILVFIASLVVFEKAVGLVTKIVELRAGVGLLAALAVTCGWVLLVRVVTKRLGEN